MNLDITIKVLDSKESETHTWLEGLTRKRHASRTELYSTVASIIESVGEEGDEALLRHTKAYDGFEVSSVADLKVSTSKLERAVHMIPKELKEAIEEASRRIHRYHEHQLDDNSWTITDDYGNHLGERITPLDRVAMYVPGGTASYPSTVLMCSIPAKLAGVKDIIVVTPSPNGVVSDAVLAAIMLSGIDNVVTIGGAQAVAAVAFGTETVPCADKIVGPGNAYVAEAKRQLSGMIGIDTVAGPSEVLIISDGSSSPSYVAADLLAQAEHDKLARVFLLCTNDAFIEDVVQQLKILGKKLERAEICAQSLSKESRIIKIADIHEGCLIANQIAAEHVQLICENAEQVADSIKHAGAIFIGEFSPVAFGDYCAGPNHVLPTNGHARFQSALSTKDFQKKISIFQGSCEGAHHLSKTVSVLAKHEGLTAHQLSAELRSEK